MYRVSKNKLISMTLQDLQAAIERLPIEERWALLRYIAQLLQHNLHSSAPQADEQARRAIVKEMRGLLKQPNKPAPNDEAIAAMKEDYLVAKYLQ